MDELHEEVSEGEMPLKSYTWTHADANLTAAQLRQLLVGEKKYKEITNNNSTQISCQKHRTYYWCHLGRTQFFCSRFKNVAVDFAVFTATVEGGFCYYCNQG